ncbi:hypothetical protein NPIL_46721 [Nephila pilipes]|uniref:Uncharacterized protein n=1 Tax=Nephila pilipes TaxID=299642 RepID=A0A8X6TZC9_NEPPI|nr:hypothetical protein NPIL_46721 [Nephila pilipes]
MNYCQRYQCSSCKSQARVCNNIHIALIVIGEIKEDMIRRLVKNVYLEKLNPAIEAAKKPISEELFDHKSRLFVTVKKRDCQLLVYSGAHVSIIPATRDKDEVSGYKLYAVNGSEIPTNGIKMQTLDLS